MSKWIVFRYLKNIKQIITSLKHDLEPPSMIKYTCEYKYTSLFPSWYEVRNVLPSIEKNRVTVSPQIHVTVEVLGACRSTDLFAGQILLHRASSTTMKAACSLPHQDFSLPHPTFRDLRQSQKVEGVTSMRAV